MKQCRDDLDVLLGLLNEMVPMSNTWPIYINGAEAEAFVHCCEKKHPNDLEKLKEFVLVSRSTRRRVKLIEQCIEQSSKASSACQRHLHRIPAMQDSLEESVKSF